MESLQRRRSKDPASTTVRPPRRRGGYPRGAVQVRRRRRQRGSGLLSALHPLSWLASHRLSLYRLELEKTNPHRLGTRYYLQELHPKAKKFRNKSFPLFEALGELYDGQTVEGTYYYSSTQQLQLLDRTQVESEDELPNTQVVNLEVEEHVAHQEEEEEVQEVEDVDASVERNDQMLERKRRVVAVSRNREDGASVEKHDRAVAARRNKEENEPKRQKKSSNLEGLMGRYLEIRAKQAEEESAQLAQEREEKVARLAREREEKEARLAREREEKAAS